MGSSKAAKSIQRCVFALQMHVAKELDEQDRMMMEGQETRGGAAVEGNGFQIRKYIRASCTEAGVHSLHLSTSYDI